MSFQVRLNGVWTTPPAYAMPVWNDPRMAFSSVVIYPQPSGRDGGGYPIRTELELRAQIGRPIINADGQYWWYTVVGQGGFTHGYINRNVMLYDPVVQEWCHYYGVLWRPTYGGGFPGHKLWDFTIQMTNLVKIPQELEGILLLDDVFLKLSVPYVADMD